MKINKLLRELKESYPSRKRPSRLTKPYISFVILPTGRLLAAIFIRIGLKNPNLITLGGFLIGILGLLFIYISNYQLAIFGAILLNVSLAVDYADGQVARYLKKSSKKGELLDAFAGIIPEIFMFPALIPLYNKHIENDTLYVTLSFCTGIFFLFHKYIGLRANSIYEKNRRNIKRKHNHNDAEKILSKYKQYILTFKKVLSGIQDLLIRDLKWIALVFAVLFRFEIEFLFIYFFAYLLSVLYAVFQSISRLTIIE